MTETQEFACSLSDKEFRGRLAMVRERLLPNAQDMHAIRNGLRIIFSASDEMRARLEELVALERECCGFLTFDLAAGPDGKTLVLTATGSDEAQPFLRTLAARIASHD